MRGRKPKPTLLKALHGSDQPRNPDEPRPAGDLTACPPHFDAQQSAIWLEAVAGAPRGLLRSIDASALETWVIAVHIQRRALAEMAQIEELSDPIAKRLLTTIGRAGQTVVKCASELGFSPASRPRVHVATGRVGWPRGPAVRGDNGPEESIEEYLACAGMLSQH